MVIRHPGLVNLRSPTSLKLYWCLCLTGGIVAAISMFVLDVPPLAVGP
jgi:hypothetical protein